MSEVQWNDLFVRLQASQEALRRQIDADLEPLINAHAPYGVLGGLERICARRAAQADPDGRELLLIVARHCAEARAAMMLLLERARDEEGAGR